MTQTHYPVAFQLYSSRHFPPILTHLPELKAMGYDAIEPWPPAFESDPEGFRRALDDNELKCFGFHMPLDGLVRDPQRYLDICDILGAKYLIPPFVEERDRKPTADFWKSIGQKLATGADHAAARGFKVLWHNHDFEYAALPDGTRPIDHILVSDNVYFEIDCGWLTRAGANLASELVRFQDRILAIQTKDLAPIGTTEDDGWTATGDGIIDWQAHVDLFRATAVDHFVTEHDNPTDWRQFAKRSIDHLRHLGLA